LLRNRNVIRKIKRVPERDYPGMRSMIMSKSDAREIILKEDKKKSRNMTVRSGQEKKGENRLLGIFKISANFLRDCKTELKRVKWPSRKELLASTAMVIFLVIIIAFFLGVADYFFVSLIELIAR